MPIVFNEPAIAEDLTHHPPVARRALDLSAARSIATAV
jgi:hypothetical protein